MRRDRLTFAMIVGIPILQLALFGYAINTDPKALPTVVVVQDASPFTRSLLAALQNTGYFKIVDQFAGEAQADRALQRGDAQFAIIIPPDFSRRMERGERPILLVAADATDPAATGNALAALEHIGQQGLDHDLIGPLAALRPGQTPFEMAWHCLGRCIGCLIEASFRSATIIRFWSPRITFPKMQLVF